MKTLWMFPGQGSQKPQMAKDWYENFKSSKLAFEEASDGCSLNLKKIIFEGSENDLKATEITQPALLTASIAIFRGLSEVSPAVSGIQTGNPSVFSGHSLGEYSALVALGALSLGTAAALVHKRGKFMQEAVPLGMGSMAALVFKPKSANTSDSAQRVCERISEIGTDYKIWVANFNSPEQIVVSGYKRGIQEAVKQGALMAEWGVRKVVELPVSAPFHCPLMQAAAEKMKSELDGVVWNSLDADLAYVANVNAKIHSSKDSVNSLLPALLVKNLERQIVGSVQWTQSILETQKFGCTRFVEIGPGSVLVGLGKRILSDVPGVEIFGIETLQGYRDQFEGKGISL